MLVKIKKLFKIFLRDFLWMILEWIQVRIRRSVASHMTKEMA